MARNKGTFKFAANFEVKLQGLLDPRGGVTNKSELINKETFPYDGDTIYMQEGMLVTVSATQEVYMLVSLANILAEDYSGWKRIDAGGITQLEVVDNLTSDSSDKALSAKQGKVLSEGLTKLENKLSSVYTYKGSVQEYTELPTDASVGDVYNVNSSYDTYPDGTNWAWTGITWDALGGYIDLTEFVTLTKVEELIKVETDRAEKAEESLSETIADIETTVNNSADIIGAHEQQLESITKNIGEINEVNSSQDQRLTTLEQIVSGGEGEGGQTLLEMVSANTQAIETLNTDFSNLSKKVNANELAIQTLNADAETEGSVDNKIQSALSWEDVV